MIHAGADAGIYELKQMAFETMESFLRAGQCRSPSAKATVVVVYAMSCGMTPCCAGATLVLSYFTPEFLDWLDEEQE